MEPGEAERRFGEYFEIERVEGGTTGSWLMPGYAAYLMTRKEEVIHIDKMETEFTNLKESWEVLG